MFGLGEEKAKKDHANTTVPLYDIEEQLQSLEEVKALKSHLINQKGQIKKLQGMGSSQEDYQKLQTLLEGYQALEDIVTICQESLEKDKGSLKNKS